MATAGGHAVPLEVIEIETGPGAAFAARLLADLGATVTKVTHGSPPDPDAIALDAGKRSLMLNLTEHSDRERLQALLENADVLICEGDAADLQVSPLSLSERRKRHARLITAAITPFGESGPRHDWRGSDLVVLHAGGLGFGTPPRVIDPEREYPLGIPGDAVSFLCGLVLVVGILHALAERDHDGNGRHVELSAEDTVASLMFNNVQSLILDGGPPGRLASDRPGARRSLLKCADGYLAMMANRPGHLRSWLEVLGPEAAPLITRLDAGEALAALLEPAEQLTERWLQDKDRSQATEIAQAHHVPMEPVLNPAELLRSPQLAVRDFWNQGDGQSGLIPGHPFGPLAPGDGPRLLPAHLHATSSIGAGTGPLAGVRVIDFGWVFAAPIATRVLAALGADVIRVETLRNPDMMRGRPFTFRCVNADKRSIELDARDPEGLTILRTLLSEADAVVENFSTGTMERLNLGWDILHATNPRLIMLSISGMGRTGPHAHHVMFGQLAQAYAGLTALVGYENGPPRGIEDGGFWSDPVTGYAGAIALLAALRERHATGRGRRIDISLVEATTALFLRPLLAAQRGDLWKLRGNYHPDMAPNDVYRCAPPDGDRWLALSVRDETEWLSLCRVLDRPDLAVDPRLATLPGRQVHHQALRQAIEGWSRRHTPEEAAALLQAAGVPAAPSRTAADLLADEHLGARGLFNHDASTSNNYPDMLSQPWRLQPAGAVRYGPAPIRGHDTAAILAEMQSKQMASERSPAQTPE